MGLLAFIQLYPVFHDTLVSYRNNQIDFVANVGNKIQVSTSPRPLRLEL